MKTQFTDKDIKRVEAGWYKIEIVDVITAIEQRRQQLVIDMAVSSLDKQDIIISWREDSTLDQDGGFLEAYSIKWDGGLKAQRAELVSWANAVAAYVADHGERDKFWSGSADTLRSQRLRARVGI